MHGVMFKSQTKFLLKDWRSSGRQQPGPATKGNRVRQLHISRGSFALTQPWIKLAAATKIPYLSQQAYPKTRCIYRGLSCMPFPPQLPSYTSRLVDSPCGPHLRRHPHSLLAKVGRYMQNAPKQMSCRMCLLWYTPPSLQPRVLLEVHKSRGDGRSGHLFHRH